MKFFHLPEKTSQLVKGLSIIHPANIQMYPVHSQTLTESLQNMLRYTIQRPHLRSLYYNRADEPMSFQVKLSAVFPGE